MARNMNDDLAIRVTVLEHDMKRLVAMPDLIHLMDKKLDRVLDQKCPAPGKCITLEQELTEVAASVKALEMKSAETKGGWKVATTIGGIAGGVIGWVVNHFSSKPHGP